MKYDNLLDEWCAGGNRCPLPSDMIHSMRNQECTESRRERQQRMIDHGEVDPDYFNR
jgi:hypothetical protein